jgi:hypothetical protein
VEAVLLVIAGVAVMDVQQLDACLEQEQNRGEYEY